jgi:NADPH-dependent 2,4-dienoyl-CoA reductase/sulfur reductase-like enzyme
LTEPVDLIVVGAGPAGMAAAAMAAGLGLSAVVIDEQAGPGGQIYRNTGRSPLAAPDVLGPDYPRGGDLARAMETAAVTVLSEATVWEVNRQRQIGLSHGGVSRMLSARHIVLATGAMERPCPIPGWTLPGVMTAGAGQLLLKSAALVPDVPVVIAGSGPLLFLVAWQYLQVGVEIAAVVETTPRGAYVRALPHLPRALGATEYLIKGLRYIRDLKRAGVRMIGGARNLAAVGGEKVEALSFDHGGSRRRIDCGLLLLHQGVVPNVQITRALGCAHDWDELQLCWRPHTDAWGNTEIDGIAVAGDGAGIAGAVAAEHRGRLAALEAAHRLGKLSESERDSQAKKARAGIARERRVRPFLDTLYRPSEEIRRPADGTIVCRCEEVTAGDVRRMVELGCLGPNQTKSYGRCGMGPCQGRLCGLTVSEIIAGERGVPVAEVGYYRIRPPIKPIVLGELAELKTSEASGV